MSNKEDWFIVAVWCYKKPMPVGEGEYFPLFQDRSKAQEWAESMNGEVMTWGEVYGVD